MDGFLTTNPPIMSKRFGRNRRRRAREEIAALQTRNTNLEQAHVLDRALSDSLGKKLRDAQDEIRRAKAILGRYCVAFMPEHRQIETGFAPYIRQAPLPRPFSIGSMSGPESDAITLAFQPMELDVIAARMHDDPIRHEMHYGVTFRDGSHGYAVTRHALLMMDRPDAVRMVSDALARSLVTHEQRRTYKP
jgi:hypothetical protein